MNEDPIGHAMDVLLHYRLDDTQYPRCMGTKNGHAVKLQQHLHDQMLAQSEFCDVTLVTGDIEMKAHWSILVSCPYFQSLYDSNMTEKMESRIVIGVGKPTAVRSAINFLYVGTIEITYSGLKDILEVADYFQIDDLKKACTDYLNCIEFTIENCVELSLLASLYDLEIYTRVFEYVRGHLPEVMKQPGMLSLTPESIHDMLKDKSLNYVSADEFFDFILRWVEHDMENRKDYFEDMFCKLELKNMSVQFLEKIVETSELVATSDNCKKHVLNIKMKRMTGLLSNDDTKDVALLVGGCGVGQFFSSFFSSPFFPSSDVMSINNVYAYVIQEDRWTELAPLPYTMRQPLVAFNNHSGCLFVIDNSSNNTTTSIEEDIQTLYMFRYNIQERTWTSLRIKMPEVCRDITIINILIANNKIYLIASSRFNYEPTAEQVSDVCLLRVSEDFQRCEVSCKLFPKNIKTKTSCCVVDDRFVCILGLKCGRRSPTSRGNKFQRFIYWDAKIDKKYECSRGCSTESLMLPMKGELCLTKYGSYKFNRFNFHTKRWHTVKELLVPHPLEEPARSDSIYTMFDNQLFVFGGKSATSKTLINNACQFNFQSKSWLKLHEIPKSIFQSGITMAKVPAEHIRCHIDCPHCKYHTARSLASYDIDYPDEDEDEDEDISYEDEDAYNYSDYWDEDFYNEYSDTDWF